MKKVFVILSIALMSAFATATASSTTGSENVKAQSEQLFKIDIPVNLVVKQTVTFDDNTSITLYYQKEGNVCRLYSNVDVTKYSEQDLNRIKSTSFEVTDHVKGKCYLTRNCSDLIKFAKSVIKQVK